MKIRTQLCLVLLLLTPLVVYWQTVFHDYGMRDDYSAMRESREEPSKLVRFTASHGRPLYGALLETTFSAVEGVEGLQWLRLTSVVLLAVLAVALWRQLYQSGWAEIEAATIGLGIVLLPAAQVTASWAVCWPQVLALLLAVAGFSAIETELERGGLKRIIALLGGGLIYCLAGLLYQSNALFAVVPIAAVFLVRAGRDRLPDMKWIGIHLLALFSGLALSYLLVRFLFNTGVFHESARLQFDTNPLTKLIWFIWQPLPNALALFALRDTFHTGEVFFWAAVLATAFCIGYGYRQARGRTDELAKKKWLVCLALLPVLAHAISLVAAERSIGYRVMFALSGLVLVMLVYTVRSLQVDGRKKHYRYYPALGLISVVGVLSAYHHSSTLFAEPQGHEWDLMRTPVMRATFKGPTKVYLITPTVAERSTARIFADEFGSLSSDSESTAREMFQAAMKERYPYKLPAGISYTVAVGRTEPALAAYDLVIDLRTLRNRRAH